MSDNELPLRALSLWQFKFFQINPLSNPFSISVLKSALLWTGHTSIKKLLCLASDILKLSTFYIQDVMILFHGYHVIKIRCDILGLLGLCLRDLLTWNECTQSLGDHLSRLKYLILFDKTSKILNIWVFFKAASVRLHGWGYIEATNSGVPVNSLVLLLGLNLGWRRCM